jgi:hypothetical protein
MLVKVTEIVDLSMNVMNILLAILKANLFWKAILPLTITHMPCYKNPVYLFLLQKLSERIMNLPHTEDGIETTFIMH